MNTKQLKSRSLLLLAVLLIASTAISWGAKPESIKKKEISKSFDVSLSDLLMTDNRYGNTTITHWNKNEVAIRVEIKCGCCTGLHRPCEHRTKEKRKYGFRHHFAETAKLG